MRKNRLLGMLLAAIIGLSLLPVGAQATSVNDALAWIEAQMGKSIDTDGVPVDQPYQCVDFVSKYCSDLFGWSPHGNARDYRTISLPAGWVRTQQYSGYIPSPGDIAVYAPGYVNGDTHVSEFGHVAIIVSADSSSYTVAQQNANGKHYVHKSVQRDYNQIWGYIRPPFDGTPVVNTFPARCTAPEALAINDKPASSSSGQSTMLGRIPKDEICTVYRNKGSGNWWWVEYHGVEGYAYSSYLTALSMPVVPTVTGVSVNGSSVSVNWSNSANAAGYDCYLIQSPWGWNDIKYQKHTYSNVISCTFSGIADGEYCAFVIARPSADDQQQSGWAAFTVNTHPATYTVTFNSNGGSAVARQTVESGKYARVPTNPTRNGYIFAGWYTDAACSNYYPFYDTVSQSMTLYARWIDRNNLPTPKKTMTYNGHTYSFYSFPTCWHTAKDICEAEGGHLATVTSAGENSFVSGLCDKNNIWLGATDSGREGTWEWVTGEAFSYSNWESGQPDNWTSNAENGEDYLDMYGAGGTWNDCLSVSPMSFVCEKDYIVSLSGSFSGSTLTATVTAPAGSMLIASVYDASGRMVSMVNKRINAACTNSQYSFAFSKLYNGYTCKLMLVDASTYAPLCESWSCVYTGM